MPHNIRFYFIAALFVTLSNAQWNTNDYLKREHSLVKPYQGKFLTFIYYAIRNFLIRILFRIWFWYSKLGLLREHDSDEYTRKVNSERAKSTRSYLEHTGILISFLASNSTPPT